MDTMTIGNVGTSGRSRSAAQVDDLAPVSSRSSTPATDRSTARAAIPIS